VGITFVGIIGYLFVNAVIPITRAGEWRTIIDIVAVSTYLIGGIPMVLLALQDLGLIYKAESEERRLARHATYVAIFLVFAHIAMVAGMMDPGLLGYVNPDAAEQMHLHHEANPADHSQQLARTILSRLCHANPVPTKLQCLGCGFWRGIR
jgi:hypothetical protein